PAGTSSMTARGCFKAAINAFASVVPLTVFWPASSSSVEALPASLSSPITEYPLSAILSAKFRPITPSPTIPIVKVLFSIIVGMIDFLFSAKLSWQFNLSLLPEGIIPALVQISPALPVSFPDPDGQCPGYPNQRQPARKRRGRRCRSLPPA